MIYEENNENENIFIDEIKLIDSKIIHKNNYKTIINFLIKLFSYFNIKILFIILKYIFILLFIYFLNYVIIINNYLKINYNYFSNETLIEYDYNKSLIKSNLIEINKSHLFLLQKEDDSKVINKKVLSFLNDNITNYFNNYIKICLKGILIDKNKYPLLKYPKISIIIPLYKGTKYLYYSLRSVQNQKMKEIEIVLIDDCSPDNSLTTIKKYMKEDERIRLILFNLLKSYIFNLIEYIYIYKY